MKKRLGIGLIALILLISSGCAAASKDAAEIGMYDIKTESVQQNEEHSKERSVGTEDGGSGAAATEPAAHDPLVYVTFSKYTDGINSENGTKLFGSRYYLPEFITEDESTNTWLNDMVANQAAETEIHMEQLATQARKDYQERVENGQTDFYAYSFYCDVTTERLDSTVISVLQVNSIYSGGAHPNYAQTAYNLNLASRRQLSLADVILPDQAELLEQGVLDRLAIQFGGLENSGLYADYPEIVPSSFSETELTTNWYFTDKSLIIYFNCYDIAPYAAGIIKVEFPYETLGGVLKPEYIPNGTQTGEGSIESLDSVDNRRVLGGHTEGEWYYFGTDQAVFDVKLCQVTGWLTNDVPIIGPTILSANRLTGAEAVSLPKTEGMDYLLSWHTGVGEVQKVVISGSEIMKIVD